MDAGNPVLMINAKVRSAVIALLGAAACGSQPHDPSPDAGVTDDLPPALRIAVDASLHHVAAHAARFGLTGSADSPSATTTSSEHGRQSTPEADAFSRSAGVSQS
jgi:hypothetical protein